MPSYFRSFFIGHSSSSPQNNSKSHKRSASASSAAAVNPNLSYIYAASGRTPSAASREGRERSQHAARINYNGSSPLRYPTYDAGSVSSKESSSQALLHVPPPQQPSIQQKPTRMHLYRTTGNAPGDRPAPYPIYSHSNSYTSVHSASTSSSMYPSSASGNHRPHVAPSTTSVTGYRRPTMPPRTSSGTSVTLSASGHHRPSMPPRTSSGTSVTLSASGHHRPSMPPRTSSGTSVTPSEPKPALKQAGNSTYGPQARVSFTSAKRHATVQMHPLLAYGRLHRPPISYDITYTPSYRAIVDRSTLTPIPSHTLAQPATEPPTMIQLVLKADKLPWPIVATASGSPASSGSSSRFYLGGPNSSSNTKNLSSAVTNLDVLYAVHNTLSARVTHQEWEALGHSSRAQRKVTRAYERRCWKLGGGWDDGVRRIDYLGEKMRLVGVEVDKRTEGGAARLVFGKL